MVLLVRESACEEIPVTLSYRVLSFSSQGYYVWLADPVCDRDWSDAHVMNEIRSIRRRDSTFGYRLIPKSLKKITSSWAIIESIAYTVKTCFIPALFVLNPAQLKHQASGT